MREIWTEQNMIYFSDPEKEEKVWGNLDVWQNINQKLKLKVYLQDPALDMSGAQLVGGGRGLSFLFLKIGKRSLILEKCTLFVCIYGLNSHLKCCFKSILEKKHQKFSLRDLSFVCRIWNVYRSVPIPIILPCSQIFLLERL